MSAVNSRLPFIFNPKSRGGLSQKFKSSILDAATQLRILGTSSKEEADTLVDQFISAGEPAIAMAGGDGTINSVLNKFLGTQTKLGVFPSGTMNVFARELGIPTTDPDYALEVLLGDHSVETDVFTVNGSPFIQMAGIGYDAHLIEETSEESKMKHGPLAYAFSIERVFGKKPPKLKVTTAEGRTEEGVCILLGNGSLYAGHFPLFSNALNNDGLIDAFIIKSTGYQAILDLAINLINEETSFLLQNQENVSFLQSSSLLIEAPESMPYELDGEYFGRERVFKVERHPHSLSVLAPVEKRKTDITERLSALWSLSAK